MSLFVQKDDVEGMGKERFLLYFDGYIKGEYYADARSPGERFWDAAQAMYRQGYADHAKALRELLDIPEPINPEEE